MALVWCVLTSVSSPPISPRLRRYIALRSSIPTLSGRSVRRGPLPLLAALARAFGPVNDRIQKIAGTGADVVELKRQSRELTSRISQLYGAIGRWTGAPTKDQLSRLAYYQQMAKELTPKAP